MKHFRIVGWTGAFPEKIPHGSSSSSSLHFCGPIYEHFKHIFCSRKIM